MKHLNLEFLFPVEFYIKTTEWYDRNWDITFPVVISAFVYFCVFHNLSICPQLEICLRIDQSSIVRILPTLIQCAAIIFSFSMACVTIFITSTNKNIESLKEIPFKDNPKNDPKIAKLTCYRRFLSAYTHCMITSALTTLYTVILYLMSEVIALSPNNYAINISVALFLLMHILFLSIRNISGLFCVFWKK